MSIVGRKVAVVLTLLAVLGFVCGSLTSYANPEKVTEKFREAINAYEEGNYKEARICFAAVLNLSPSTKLAAELRDSATLKYLLQIAQEEQVGTDVWKLINLANEFDNEQRRDPAVIKKLVGDLDRDLQLRKVAMEKLISIGAFAIPFLVKDLSDPNEEDGMRTYAYITIQKMGRNAVQPLIELLNCKDPLLVQNCCLILSNMNDVRPVPYLLQIAQNEKINASIRRTASMGFKKNTGIAVEDALPLENYFYNEALRYYLNSPIVEEEAYSAQEVIWVWDDKAKNVVAKDIPRFAFNEEISRKRCFDGLAVAPESAIFTPLLVCLAVSQVSDLDARVSSIHAHLAKVTDTTEKNVLMSTLESYGKEIAKVQRAHAVTYLVGQKNLVLALDIALKHKNYVHATAIIKAYAEVSDGSLLPAPDAKDVANNPAASIIRALDSDSAMVRYSAAIALGKINPPKAFFGMEKVALTLAAALGDTSDINVFVVDNEIDKMNRLVQVVQESGYGAQGAFSGRACLAKAGIFPIKDIILLDYTLDDDGDITIDEVYRGLKAEAHTRNIPIIFLVPDTMIKEFRAKFPEDSAFVSKPVNEKKLVTAIADVVEKGDFSNAVRDQINSYAIMAAQTLAMIPVNDTRLDLKVAIPTLIGAFSSSLDKVRVGAMKTIANLKAAEALESLMEVFKNSDNSSMVRITSLEAIGAIDPAKAKDLLVEAVGDKDPEIAKAAAIALGKKDFPVGLINELIKKSQVK